MNKKEENSEESVPHKGPRWLLETEKDYREEIQERKKK